MQTADLLIHPRWVLPINPANTVLDAHSVAVNAGKIAAVIPSDDARRNWQAQQSIDLPDHVLMPGLVNAHTHTPMSLLRGFADDMPLMSWLRDYIWPAERRWVSSEFVRTGSQLAYAELLRGGVTCFNDMYFFPQVSAQLADEVGIRACIGMLMMDLTTAYADNPNQYLEKGLELHEQFHNHPTIHPVLAPHAPYTVPDKYLQRIAGLGDELNLQICMHLHETTQEIEDALKQYGSRPLQRLAALGLLSSRLLAVHAIHLQDDEIRALVEAGAAVIHCPKSNLKLASGFCPVQKLLDAGVCVALGTDGAAGNNHLDMIGEMQTATLLAKGVSKDATAVPAHRALEMATLAGARALKLDARIGSVEVGKSADLITIDLSGPEAKPLYDVASHLVYATDRRQVSDVWVAGRHLLQNHTLTTIDIDELGLRVLEWEQKISGE